MAAAAAAAGVAIVAGDTKVVERGKADQLYVTTTGIGVPDARARLAAAVGRAGDARHRVRPDRRPRRGDHARSRRPRPRGRRAQRHGAAVAGRRRPARRLRRRRCAGCATPPAAAWRPCSTSSRWPPTCRSCSTSRPCRSTRRSARRASCSGSTRSTSPTRAASSPSSPRAVADTALAALRAVEVSAGAAVVGEVARRPARAGARPHDVRRPPDDRHARRRPAARGSVEPFDGAGSTDHDGPSSRVRERGFLMSRRRLVVGLSFALVASTVTWSSSQAKPAPPTGDVLAVYRGEVDAATVAADRRPRRRPPRAAARAGGGHGRPLRRRGDPLGASRRRASRAPAASWRRRRRRRHAGRRRSPSGVFRPYSGPGGIQEELVAQAAAYPRIAELQVIGQTVQRPGHHRRAGHPATRAGPRTAGARRPSTSAAQHAREWITPEMVRRLLDHILTGYGTDPDDHRARRTTTSCGSSRSPTPTATTSRSRTGHRLWRKNLRDNDGDGVITPGDGVDLNRNYPTRWGYDNEGSSPNPTSDTYRGPAPASEPETQAHRRAVPRASRRSSSSTTTPPPSCCSTASAGRSPRRRPTT